MRFVQGKGHTEANKSKQLHRQSLQCTTWSVSQVHTSTVHPYMHVCIHIRMNEMQHPRQRKAVATRANRRILRLHTTVMELRNRPRQSELHLITRPPLHTYGTPPATERIPGRLGVLPSWRHSTIHNGTGRGSASQETTCYQSARLILLPR